MDVNDNYPNFKLDGTNYHVWFKILVMHIVG